jgi:vacuolar-type H+-ATPase subunit F/Vma7
MIVLGTAEFALGMKFAGIKDSYVIKSRAEAIDILKKTEKDDFILANASIIELVPELKQFPNLVSIPDDAHKFGSIDDLKEIIKSVVGIELEVV